MTYYDDLLAPETRARLSHLASLEGQAKEDWIAAEIPDDMPAVRPPKSSKDDPRLAEVLRLKAAGRTWDEIGAALKLSGETCRGIYRRSFH